ncbi:universal stress protein [Puerhibacterium sp. TATVAM-FAB25]|uniref:universal stress protein n=1 Tax=Puerhibacterium sp. TATVAM-FAB25 TaxID=3093699 RepID=UPI003979FBFB
MNDSWSIGVVVGVDASPESAHALEWAVPAAARHDGHVVAVSAYPPSWGPLSAATAGAVDQARRECEGFVRRAVARLAPDAAAGVVRRAEPGNPAAVLVGWSRSADLVVVGRSGAAGLDRLVLGSVSRLTAAMARGPVAVVPPTARVGAPERVVVGVGGLDEDPTGLLDVAFAEGRAAGCPVRVVHAVEPRSAADLLASELLPAGPWDDTTEVETRDLLERWSDKYTDVDRTVELRRGDAATVLLDEATERDVVIVGGRRHPATVGRLLGSVPDAVVRRARGTVVIVHEHKER